MCWCWLLVVFGVGCWLCRRRVGQRRCAALSRMSRRWPRSARRQPKDTVSLLPSSRLKSATSAAMPPASLTAMHADAELSIPSWRWWRSASRACGAGSSLTMVMSPSCMCDRMRARLASSTRSVAPVRGIPSVGAQLFALGLHPTLCAIAALVGDRGFDLCVCVRRRHPHSRPWRRMDGTRMRPSSTISRIPGGLCLSLVPHRAPAAGRCGRGRQSQEALARGPSLSLCGSGRRSAAPPLPASSPGWARPHCACNRR